MAPHEMTDQQMQIIEKVKKLLALSQNNDNEHQAEAAAAKAMELLAAYNLDMASIGPAKSGARKDNTLKGGLYGWQRSLWQAVAELNFCMYWSIRGLAKGSTYEHRILGSEVNVASTQVMADYLQQTVERLTREYAAIHFPGRSIFVKALIAYREGMAARLSARLFALRDERIEEDRRKAAEQKAATNHPGAAPTGNALVLLDVIESEADLNTDYLYNLEPGTTAARRAARKARQEAANAAYWEEYERRKAEQEAYDLAHPEEAARRKEKERRDNEKWEAKWRRAEERRANRKPTAAEERRLMHTFTDGYAKGGSIGLDQQINNEERRSIK